MDVTTLPSVEPVKAYKAVRFNYRPTRQTVELLETFRQMVNEAIQVCLTERINGRLKLRNKIYRVFRVRYGVVSDYPYSVSEVAWSIIRKHRKWQRRPFASHLLMKLDRESYSLRDGILRIPFKTNQARLLIPLEYGDYQRSFLMDATLKRGSVTITEFAVVIAFSREVAEIAPLSKVGYDLNEKSIVGSDGRRVDLSEVARLHAEYGTRRSSFYSRHPNDRRLKQRFASSRREKERVKQFLHRVAKEIVEKAKANRQAIILERLKNIRYAHQRGNGEGKTRRRRIALWPFRQLQGYMGYKAVWAGVPIEYVNPSRTSQTCHLCNFVNQKLQSTEREWLCPNCGVTLDRDLNAAINIVRRGKIACPPLVLAGARGRGSDETGTVTDEPNPAADALKLAVRQEPRSW